MEKTGEKTYRIITGGEALLEDHGSLIPKALIEAYPWSRAEGAEDYRPYTTAQMACLPEFLYVRMETAEDDPKAQERGFSGEVYTDSCMELFLMPDPEHSPDYFNWEFNAEGAMYLSLGSDRFNRRDINPEDYMSFFRVRPERRPGRWSVEYRILHEFIRSYFPDYKPEEGWRMKGNFYKCGEKTKYPHYGCFAWIDLPEPDFHSPGFFGTFIIEKGL
ncbi:MAG: hypothetical protein GXX92_04610 [Clostridiales bacterium]|nr:hypothetical protein [Clostridiales bacterium]